MNTNDIRRYTAVSRISTEGVRRLRSNLDPRNARNTERAIWLREQNTR